RARERGGIAVPQRDAGAARVQTLRDGEADAGRAAGDDGRAAVEVEAIHRMRENVDERAPDLSIGQATSIPRKRESSTNASHCRETAHRISVIPAKAGIQYERVILPRDGASHQRHPRESGDPVLTHRRMRVARISAVTTGFPLVWCGMKLW